MLLSEVVADICGRAGIATTSIDVSEFTTVDEVVGYQIPRQMPARTALETLMAAYNFDAVERDWKMYFKKRGSTSVASIAANELRAHAAGEQTPDRIIETRTQDLELPTHFTLSYESKVRDYEIASQNAVRVDKQTYMPKAASLGLVMTDAHAKQQAEVLLKQMWGNRHRYAFSTTYKYLRLAPGDVITVSGKQMRVVSMSDRNGIVDFICESEEGGQYVSAAQADDLTIEATDVASDEVVPVFVSMDIPPISEDFGSAGLTFAVYSTGSYGGGIVSRSLDGSAYTDVGFFSTVAAVVGNVSNALTSVNAGEILDYTTSLTVDLSTSAGAVATVTTTQLWNDGNLAAVGSQANGWEIIQFLTATSSTTAHEYTLTGLLRGQRGTKQYMGSHTTSDKFVLLTDSSGDLHRGVNFVFGVLTDVDVNYYFKARSYVGAEGSPVTLPIGRKTLDPYAPEVAYGSRNSSNDVEVGWYRGDRYEFTQVDFPDSSDIDMSEVSLNYTVNVIHPVSSAVLRSVNTTVSTWTYTAAMQTSDSYPQTHPVIFDIYQNSTVTSTSGPRLRASI